MPGVVGGWGLGGGGGRSWFSSLVGKKQHLKGLIARLRRCQVSLIQSTEFVQGKTSRWGLAWSYTRLPPGAAKGPLQARSKLSFTLQVRPPHCALRTVHAPMG